MLVCSDKTDSGEYGRAREGATQSKFSEADWSYQQKLFWKAR